MKKFLPQLIVLFLLLVMVPFTSFAIEDEEPDMGTFVVNITNGTTGDQDFVGEWHLHKYKLSGMSVRDGMKSDTFKIEPGIYYLEVNRTDNYKYHTLDLDNQQVIGIDETITFNAVYYKTEEEMLAGIVPEPTPEPEPEPEPEVEPPADEPEPEPEPEPVVDEPIEPLVDTYYVYAPTFDTSPTPDVPDFQTAPDTASSPWDEDYGLGAVQLAQTGPGLLFLLVPSVFGGLYFAGRRKR